MKQNLKTALKRPLSLLLRIFILLSAAITMGVLLYIIIFIVAKGAPHLSLDLFAWEYTSDNVSIMPAIINTLIMTGLSLVIAVPLGIFAAIYLVEYAKRGSKLVKVIRMTAETLSGIPSIIYGYRRKIYVNGELEQDHVDPSPVKEVYTNNPAYGDLHNEELQTAIDEHKLDWKYMILENKEIVDGIEYQYLTSDWYILTLENFPTIEKPFINIDQRSSYFRTLTEAFHYIDQLIA